MKFLSTQDSVDGFLTQLWKSIFYIVEISVDMEYYLDNNFLLTCHDFPPKIWNPDSTFTKTTFLQTVPADDHRSFSQHKIQFPAL